MKRVLFVFLLLFGLVLSSTENGFAIEQAIIKRESAQKIEALKLNALAFDIGTPDIEGESGLRMEFWGIFNAPDTQLTVGNHKVAVDENHLFRVTLPLTGVETIVDLEATGPSGTIKETVKFELPRYEALSRKVVLDTKGHTRFSLSLGLTPTFYVQPGVANYSEIGLTGKIGIDQSFTDSNWSLGFNAFTTILPLFIVTDSLLKNQMLRFLGSNLRIGYSFKSRKSPWVLSLMFGPYYTTTYTADQIGYQNFGGLQLFPVLARKFLRGDAVSFYFKFSPVSADFSLLSLESREFATGSSFSFAPQRNGTFWSIHADVAFLTIHRFISDINLLTSSFSFAYHF